MQRGGILAMIYFAKCDSSVAATKVLANAPKLVMAEMKKHSSLSEKELVKFFVEVLRKFFLCFKTEAVDDDAMFKMNLESVSRKVIVEGFGFDMEYLQECFHESSIWKTSQRSQAPVLDVDVAQNERVGNNADSREPSRDSQSKVSGKTMARKRNHSKTNAAFVEDGIEKNDKKYRSRTHTRSKDKSVMSALSVLPSSRAPSSKALCAAKCLSFSEDILKDVSFFTFKCRDKRYVIDGLRKLESSSDAILFIDATSLGRGKMEDTVEALSRCNVRAKKILFWSTQAITETSIQVEGFSLMLESEHVVPASRGIAAFGKGYYAQLLLPSGASFKGPTSTKNVFSQGESEAEVFEWFYSTAFSGIRELCDLQCQVWVDFTSHSQVVVLECLIRRNFGVAYCKILKDGVDHELANLDCLLALRRKVSTLCSCGGHSLLSASNHATLNDLNNKTYGNACYIGAGYPFIMDGHGEDKMPHGNVKEHPSLLLKKNMIGETPALDSICYNDTGFLRVFNLCRSCVVSFVPCVRHKESAEIWAFFKNDWNFRYLLRETVIISCENRICTYSKNHDQICRKHMSRRRESVSYGTDCKQREWGQIRDAHV